MTIRILIGDVREQLRLLPADSFDCVVTSPPYWGLRDYGVAGQIGLEPTLGEHLEVMVDVFNEVRRVMKPSATLWLNYGDCYATSPNGRSAADTRAVGNDDRTFRDKPFSTIGGVLKAKDLAMLPNRLAIALQEPRYVGKIKSELDRIWLAAIIDGEGSIYIHRQPEGTSTGRNSARTQDNFCVGIAISNCSEAIVRKAALICGRDNIHMVESNGSNRRDHYNWRVTGNIAKVILTEIYPYLVAKQREARVAISCPPSGDIATATWLALKDFHKGRLTDFDAKPPNVGVLWEPGWWVRSEIIWHKPNPMPESIKDRPGTSHEKVWLLSKSQRYFYDAEAVAEPAAYVGVAGQDANGFKNPLRFSGKMAESSKQDGHGRRHAGFNKRWDEAEERGECSETRNLRNVWTIATAAFSEAHFATFPPELAERCIKAGCPAGGHVLDPFGGAGTTGIVADRLQRDATLIELNPEYADIARRRISGDAPLFTEVA